jgi:hypothetical protein
MHELIHDFFKDEVIPDSLTLGLDAKYRIKMNDPSHPSSSIKTNTPLI